MCYDDSRRSKTEFYLSVLEHVNRKSSLDIPWTSWSFFFEFPQIIGWFSIGFTSFDYQLAMAGYGWLWPGMIPAPGALPFRVAAGPGVAERGRWGCHPARLDGCAAAAHVTWGWKICWFSWDFVGFSAINQPALGVPFQETSMLDDLGVITLWWEKLHIFFRCGQEWIWDTMGIWAAKLWNRWSTMVSDTCFFSASHVSPMIFRAIESGIFHTLSDQYGMGMLD